MESPRNDAADLPQDAFRPSLFIKNVLLDSSSAEELIDDMDKLSLVEAAVIMNSFAHFQCWDLGCWRDAAVSNA